jgi:hypothetical protein
VVNFQLETYLDHKCFFDGVLRSKKYMSTQK